MKFGESIPSAAQARADARATFRFTLEQGAWAGQSFAVTLHICPNPVCPCAHVGFECRPLPALDAAEAGGPASPASLRFDLDMFKRAVYPQVKSSPEGATLAGAVATELQASDWEALAQFFLATKRRQMEVMDLDTIEVVFPEVVMAGESSMVGYREVFPWGEAFEFAVGGARWMVRDLYCVQPGCTCTASALEFYRLPDGAMSAPVRLVPEALLRYNYVSGKTEVEEAKQVRWAAGQSMEALRERYPDLAQIVSHRHQQLQRLGQRLLAKPRRQRKRPFWSRLGGGEDPEESAPASAPKVAAHPKVGRNDPCPCGSGRKFKKCCGATAP